MPLITRSDLYYKDYSWTALYGDNPKVTGEPDSTLLNRREGYEILYFVNKFSEIHKVTQKLLATKIERMVRDEVPHDIRSQEGIRQWIYDHWQNSRY